MDKENFCAYCVVPYARGREVYRDANDILKEVEDLVKKGYKEIILIAQNVNSYISENPKSKIQMSNKIQMSKSKIINFSELLRSINNIKGNFWIRFATSHPKDMSNDLIRVIAKCVPSTGLRTGKVCEHVHLPVQAGDDEILRKMNRKYTRKHYVDLISRIKSELNSNNFESNEREWRLPLAITTDIIVGFPGETKEQFNNTVKLFKEIKFDMAYIAQYNPRPGTASAKMKDDVLKKEKKRREEELMKILRKTAFENNKKYIDKTVEVLVEGKGKGEEWFGKTRTFKNVRITKTRKHENTKTNLIRGLVKVKINKVKDFGLEGDIIK